MQSWGVPTDTWMWSPIWKLSEPHNLGLFLETSLQRHNRSLTQSPPLLLLGRWGVGLKVLHFQSRTGLLWWPEPILQVPGHQSHLVRIKDAPITQGISRVLKTLRQEPGAKTKNVFLIMSQWLWKWLAVGDMTPSPSNGSPQQCVSILYKHISNRASSPSSSETRHSHKLNWKICNWEIPFIFFLPSRPHVVSAFLTHFRYMCLISRYSNLSYHQNQGSVFHPVCSLI